MSDQPPNNDFTPEPGTLVIEDQSLRYGFVALPKQVLWAQNLSRDAKFLYAVLLGFAWQEKRCFPGYGRLCFDMGASENFVRKCMRELEGVGLVKQKRRGLGLTNIYRLPDLRTAQLEVQEPYESGNKSRTSRGAVQEPHATAALEPAPGEVKIETVKEEPVEVEFEDSKIRKRSNDVDNDEDDAPGRSVSYFAGSPLSGESGREDNGLTPIGDALPTRYGGRGRPPRAYSEDRQAILAFVQDFARELGDTAPLQSSTTRALNLYRQSGVSRDVFIDRLYQARAITQERSGSITSKTDNGSGFPRKQKMAYFFSVLQDRLGLKEATSQGSNVSDH